MSVVVTTRKDLWNTPRTLRWYRTQPSNPQQPLAGRHPLTPPGGFGGINITIDPLRLTRFQGPQQPTSRLTKGKPKKLEVSLPAHGIQQSDLEYVVLVHVWTDQDGKEHRRPVPWSQQPKVRANTATFQSLEPQIAPGDRLELVDARDPAAVAPVGSASVGTAPGAVGDKPKAWILLDGENIGYATAQYWWDRNAGRVAAWLDATFSKPTVPSTCKMPFKLENHRYPLARPVQTWLGSASHDHPRTKPLRKQTSQVGAQWATNTQGKDHADALLLDAHKALINSLGEGEKPPLLLLMNGDGQPSSLGPNDWNCFVAVVQEHVRAGGKVKSLPLDHRNGCSPMWGPSSIAGNAKLRPKNVTDESWQSWLDDRDSHVDRSEDLLSAVFPATSLRHVSARLGQLHDSWRKVHRAVAYSPPSFLNDWLQGKRATLPDGGYTRIPVKVQGWKKSSWAAATTCSPWEWFAASTFGALSAIGWRPLAGNVVGARDELDPGPKRSWPNFAGPHPVIAAVACMP